MFSNIVVGTDGSDTAALAVSLAADLAKQHGAVLHLISAYKLSTAVADPGVTGELLRGASDMLLTEVAQTLSGTILKTRSVPGNPADVLVAMAEEVGADLIVVGSKGMRGARRVIGSVPNTIAHHAPCHVLIAKTA